MSRLGKRRPALQVLALESREVPAVAISLVGGNLTVTGDNVANTLVVKATADNQFQVLNTASENPQANLGTYNVPGNLNIRMGNSADNVTLDVGEFTYTGSVAITTGNGADIVSLGGNAGTINGAVTCLTGAGDDLMFFTGPGLLTVAGNFSINMDVGNDSTFWGFGSSNFGSSVYVTNANFVASDVPCDIAGNLIVTSTEGLNNTFAFGFNVGGNVTFTSSAGNDLFRVNEDSTIAGNLMVNLGAGNNTFQLGSDIGPTGAADVGGSVTLLAGNGNDTFQIGSANAGSGGGSAIGGSLNINSGDGNNVYDLAADLILAGSLTVTAGNGSDDLATNPVQAILAGNATFLLGNGNNSLTMGAASTLSGNLYFRTGGGLDTLTLLAAQSYQLNASFGAGNDLFVMNNAGLLLNGFLDFGAGNDVMTQTAGTFGNINIINL